MMSICARIHSYRSELSDTKPLLNKLIEEYDEIHRRDETCLGYIVNREKSIPIRSSIETILSNIYKLEPELGSLIKELNEPTLVSEPQLDNLYTQLKSTILWEDPRLRPEKCKIEEIILQRYSRSRQICDTCKKIFKLMAHLTLFGSAYQVGHQAGLQEDILIRKEKELEILANYSNDFLKYNKEDPRKKALILRAVSDHNSALSLGRSVNRELLSKMLAIWDSRFGDIIFKEQMCHEIAYAGQFGPIGPIVLQGHGWPQGIHFSEDQVLSTENLNELPLGCFNTLSGIEGPIVLNSCSTGKGGEESFAQNLADKSGLEVIAATEVAYGAVLEENNPLIFSIKGGSRDVSMHFHPKVCQNPLGAEEPPINVFDPSAAIGIFVVIKVGSTFFRSMGNLLKMLSPREEGINQVSDRK